MIAGRLQFNRQQGNGNNSERQSGRWNDSWLGVVPSSAMSFLVDTQAWEKAIRGGAIAITALLLLSSQAHANCKDELRDLKSRIDRIKTSDKERYARASKWWGQAATVEPTSETQCHNYELRARRALAEPKEMKGCSTAGVQSQNCAAAQKAEPPAVGSSVPPAPPEPPAMIFMNPLR